MFDLPVFQSTTNPPRRRRRLAGAGPKPGVELLERRELLDAGLAAGLTSAAASRLLGGLYTDLLNRAPQPSELAAWQNAVNSGPSMQNVAQAFLSSPEYQADFITDTYTTLLKRQPQAQEVNGWLQATQAGLSEEGVTSQFLASEEYYQGHGGTPEGWLTGLYWDLFQRTPDAAGFFLWRNELQSGMSRETIASGFVTSSEANTRFVTAGYQQFLGRTPDAAGAASWVGALDGGLSRTQFIAALLGSAEYALTHSSGTSELPGNPAANGSPADFAFGPAWSSAAPGSTEVALVSYSPQTGYGWDSVLGLVVQDGGGITGSDNTFRVDLPNGTYTVTPTFGDTTVAHNNMAVWAQGVQEVAGLNTAAGQFIRPSFNVQVTNGQLVLRFAADGAGNTFAVHKLDIVPTSSATMDPTSTGATSTSITPASAGSSLTQTNPGDGSPSLTPAASGISANFAAITLIGKPLPVTVSINGAPASSSVNLPIAVTSTVSDPNPGAAAAGFKYQWAVIFNNMHVATATTPSFSFTPRTAGTYSLRLAVTDEYNLVGREILGITVGNALTLTPSSLPNGTADSAYTAALTATGGSGSYTFAVSSGSLPSGLSLNPNTGVVSGMPMTPGSSTFTITANDSKTAGLTGRQAYTLSVNSSVASPPVVSAGANISTKEGSVIQFAGTATGGTAPYTYSWDFGDGDKASGSLTPSYTYANSGTYTATLTVSDAQNQVAQSSLQVTVQDVAPSVSINGAPSSSTVGTPLSLTSAVTSPSSTDMAAGFSYAWSITKDGTPLHAGTTQNFSFTPSAAATYVATLTVTAKDGASGTTSQTITVSGGVSSGPLSVAINGAPASSPEGAPIALTSTVTSSSAADMAAGFSYSWNVTKDGAAFTSATTPNLSFKPSDRGTYVITLTATAQDQTSGTASQTISVSDVAPLVTISGAPASSPPGTTLALTSSVFSPSTADTAAGFRYAWSVTSNNAVVASGTAASFSFTPASAGTYVVALTATDSDGATGTASQSISVAAAASGGWIHVQDDPGGGALNSPTATTNTFSLSPFASPVTVGDYVFVGITGLDSLKSVNAVDVTCTDNATTPNGYTQLYFYRETIGDTDGWVCLFAAKVAHNPSSGNLSPTIHIGNGKTTLVSWGASEFSGGSLTLDGSVQVRELAYMPPPYNTTLNFTMTTTQPNDLLIGIFSDNRGGSYSWTPPSGFTALGTQSDGNDFLPGQWGYRIVSGTLSNQQLSWSNNGANQDGTVCAMIAALEV